MKFVYGLHLMWYEVEMLEEHLSSLSHAAKNTNIPIEFVLCTNHQTFIETPIDEELANKFQDKVSNLIDRYDSVFSSKHYFSKYNTDGFYNIADFRRDIYKILDSSGYVIWGEVDSVLPKYYFTILESLLSDSNFSHPHIMTFASRKCWDYTWEPVEHEMLRVITLEDTPAPFRHSDYITQSQLNEFNSTYVPEIVQIPIPKIDGALLALRDGLPQHIPDDMHFAREDFVAQKVFEFYEIPQYHVSNILKGHNYNHPNKRTNTYSSRTDSVYKQYESESFATGINYVRNLKLSQ